MTPLWKMDLPWQVKKILTTLNENNYEAFVVGGSVRDALLGKVPHDFDVATSATPDIIAQLFSSYKIIDVGIRHGTIAVIIDHLPIEITTYRTEGKYREHRWPIEVSFTTSLREDMKRRDFTINALAYHPDLGIIDYFGGINDLKLHRVCAVGDAAKRFDEDALRIIRCLRFASVLGFSIEKETSIQVEEKAHLLDVIAWERKKEEFFKLLSGSHFDWVIEQYISVISYIIPELKQVPSNDLNKCLSEMKVIDSTYEMVSIARFVILLSYLNLPMEKCNVMCQRLSLSNSITKQISKVLQSIDELKCEIGHHQATFACKKWLRDLGLSNIDLFFTCSIAMNLLALDEVNRYKKEITKILQNKEPYLLSHLAVNGKDIQKLGIPAGPYIGQILEFLLEEVIHERLCNDHQTLLDQVGKFFDSR